MSVNWSSRPPHLCAQCSTKGTSQGHDTAGGRPGATSLQGSSSIKLSFPQQSVSSPRADPCFAFAYLIATRDLGPLTYCSQPSSPTLREHFEKEDIPNVLCRKQAAPPTFDPLPSVPPSSGTPEPKQDPSPAEADSRTRVERSTRRMKDPFFLEPLPWLVKATQPFADYFSLPTLPIHVHEVFASALLYSVIYYPVSPLLSRLIVGRKYTDLPRKRRINWDAHVVSFVQSVLINGLALWVMFVDEERSTMDWQARMWGYTGAAGMIQGLAAGYFLWDLVVTSLNFDVFGIGTLAHAVSALFVFSLGFRPFLNYYGCIFILWELSTPFLNIHWFFDKLGMTGSRAQLYNGLMLLFTFFSCRLVYGTYQSVKVFSDIYAAINAHPVLPKEISPETGAVLAPIGVMRFATGSSTVPTWLAVTYLMSNITLNSLNFYWFIMMIRAVRKRFQPAKSREKQAAIEPSSAKATAPSVGVQARRRKA